MNIPLILGWYLICLLIIKGIQYFLDLTNKPAFRDSEGDVTTEVGYNEDSLGNLLPYNQDDECPDPELPHIQSTGGTNMGSL